MFRRMGNIAGVTRGLLIARISSSKLSDQIYFGYL